MSTGASFIPWHIVGVNKTRQCKDRKSEPVKQQEEQKGMLAGLLKRSLPDVDCVPLLCEASGDLTSFFVPFCIL